MALSPPPQTALCCSPYPGCSWLDWRAEQDTALGTAEQTQHIPLESWGRRSGKETSQGHQQLPTSVVSGA